MMPALLTRMSMPCACATISATRAEKSCGFSRSQTISRNLRPRAVTAPAVSGIGREPRPTMSAPALASASASALPRPVRAPVTRATFPDRSKSLVKAGSVLVVMVGSSAKVLHGDHVHVGEGLVVAGHAPDEGIACRAGAAVDGPGRRDHGLLVADDEMARRLGAPHEMHREGVLRQLKVEVGLHPAVVGVGRHRVPHA